MPVKFRKKIYKTQTYYYIYNKGIDSRDIFVESGDYDFFVGLLRRYTTRFEDKTAIGYKTLKPSLAAKKQSMNLTGDVQVVAYCLLPNRFHLLLRQESVDGIVKCMRRVITAYVMYFNKKYKRRGSLFESAYRGRHVDEDLVVTLTKFIHLVPVSRTVRRFGPVETVSATRPDDYLYSSYSQYIGINGDKWVNIFLGDFSVQEYKMFIDHGRIEGDERLNSVVLDDLNK